MKIYMATKYNANNGMDTAVFLEHEFTKGRQEKYKERGYDIKEYDSAEEFVVDLNPSEYYDSISDGEVLDIMVQLLDKGFIDWTLDK